MKWAALLVLCLSACDAASNEYPPVGDARSAAAEWAEINQSAAEGRVTRTYVGKMREELRSELERAAAAFSNPNSAEAREVAALQALPPDAPAPQIQTHVEKLKSIEDGLAVS